MTPLLSLVQPRESWENPISSFTNINIKPSKALQIMATKLRSLRLPPLSRFYHSTTHPAPPGPFKPIESAILSAALPHVPSHGFTSITLALGATDAGYLPASTNLFPAGAFSLVHYHLYTQRLALARHTGIISPEKAENGGKPMGVGGKVKALTWKRLMGSREVIHRWQEVCRLLHIQFRNAKNG